MGDVTAYVNGHLGVLLALALALVAVGWRPLWRWTRTVVTIAHEGEGQGEEHPEMPGDERGDVHAPIVARA